MAHSTNGHKDEQLGMPNGTACNRLRRMIFFELVKRCGEDICCICGERILTYSDLTIQHKEPWLHVSKELFWDLDNIGFAHHACNVGERRNGVGKTGGIARRKFEKEGTTWCVRHQEFLPAGLFGKRKSRWNGYDLYCLKCRSEMRSVKQQKCGDGRVDQGACPTNK
jgi:hypothetical protein